MFTARPRVLDDFPYPVAYPYSLVFDTANQPFVRRWALCYTEYQLLRLVGLPLVCQYLLEPIEPAEQPIEKLNTAIAGLRSPFFSDWITLAYTLRDRLPQVGVRPLFAGLSAALDAVKQTEERPVGLRGRTKLAPLEAILALRNAVTHGGLADETEAERHLRDYIPVLHQIVAAFDFVGDSDLQVCVEHGLNPSVAVVRSLRGHRLNEAVERELSDEERIAFEESPAVLRGPDGQVVPLYPLLNPLPDRKPLYLYDGHYGTQVTTKQQVEERSYVCYLGVHHRTEDAPSCDRLKDLLRARQISFFMDKGETAPWTIAQNTIDYSNRTLADLLSSKYFPECYVPFDEMERHFERFLTVPDPKQWPAKPEKPAYINGFLLVGLAGAGKTAFLARRVEALLRPAEVPGGSPAQREQANIVLFLRGNGIALRPEGMSLFADVAEKLGVAIEGATLKKRDGGGFASFRELLDALHGKWKQDRVPGRRLILVLDALNEAPFAEAVIREALEMVGVAAYYPWCKVVASARQEWLSIWSGKLQAQEANPLEGLRRWLYHVQPAERKGEVGLPVMSLEPMGEAQAAEVYGNYQRVAALPREEGVARLSACATPWDGLAAATRGLLLNPLYLHLFMEAFAGRPAERLSSAGPLFSHYVNRVLHGGRGHLERDVAAVFGYLLEDVERPSADLNDDDANAIRRRWAAGLSEVEARNQLSPAEALAHEGWMHKRVLEKGGGYRFLYQQVAEYLLYRHLERSRPEGEGEAEYWGRKAAPQKVFAEYKGAFGFLLRVWIEKGRIAEAARLVEEGAGWLQDVLAALLVVQAQTAGADNAEGGRLDQTVKVLAAQGRTKCAVALDEACIHLWQSQFAIATPVLSRAAAHIWQRLWDGFFEARTGLKAEMLDDNEKQELLILTEGLATSNSSLGFHLSELGQFQEAEEAHRRSLRVRECQWADNPTMPFFVQGLGATLVNLSKCLMAAGKTTEAVELADRALRLLRTTHPGSGWDTEVQRTMALALNNLGVSLLGSDSPAEKAEQALRQAVELYEALLQLNPEEAEDRSGLVRALTNLATAYRRREQSELAETSYLRAVAFAATAGGTGEISPLDVVRGLALANAGGFYAESNRFADAEDTLTRAAELLGKVVRLTPEHLDGNRGYRIALSNLVKMYEQSGRGVEAVNAATQFATFLEGIFVADRQNLNQGLEFARAATEVGRLMIDLGAFSDAAPVLRHALIVYVHLASLTPDAVNLDVSMGLCRVLHYQSLVFAVTRQFEQAEQVLRFAVDHQAALFSENPQKAELGRELARSLNNRASMLCQLARLEEAEEVYRRAVVTYQFLWENFPPDSYLYDAILTTLVRLSTMLREGSRVTDLHAFCREYRSFLVALAEFRSENAELRVLLDHAE